MSAPWVKNQNNTSTPPPSTGAGNKTPAPSTGAPNKTPAPAAGAGKFGPTVGSNPVANAKKEEEEKKKKAEDEKKKKEEDEKKKKEEADKKKKDDEDKKKKDDEEKKKKAEEEEKKKKAEEEEAAKKKKEEEEAAEKKKKEEEATATAAAAAPKEETPKPDAAEGEEKKADEKPEAATADEKQDEKKPEEEGANTTTTKQEDQKQQQQEEQPSASTPAATTPAAPAQEEQQQQPVAATQPSPSSSAQRLTVGNTEYVFSKLNDRDGDFWTPIGLHNGDPDYSFSERIADGGTGKKIYVHVTTKAKSDNLVDWTQVAEPEPLGVCITIFSSGTVTAYRLCEITAKPVDGTTVESVASPSAASPAATSDQKEQKIAVYAPTQMCPDPPLEHCWAPKLDRPKSKYFFVNCATEAKLWVLPEVTDIASRVLAIFRRYAPSREPEVETLVKECGGNQEKHESLIKKLTDQYGPEPGVIEAKTRERLTAIFAKYDRAKLDDFESLLAENIGKEEQLIKELLRKYNAVSEPPTYRQRITALFDKYAPEKVPTVDETLRVYHGKELQFIVALVKRLGPEPLMPCKPNKTPDEIGQYRLRARRMYQKFCPSRLNTVDGTMETYKNLEELMMETLIRKYGPEPDANEKLPEYDENGQEAPESPMFGKNRALMGEGGQPVSVVPLDYASALQQGLGMNLLSPEEREKLAAHQQQSAISLLTDMEERLRGAYTRLEEAHQRAEALRNENLRLHEQANRSIEENDVTTQILRKELAQIQARAEETLQSCQQEKEKLKREYAQEISNSTHKLQEELLNAEQQKLEHQKILSELHGKLCSTEEEKGETTVQTTYLRQRVASLETEIEEARKTISEMQDKLRERQEVNHRGIQTGGDDAELRSELKQRRVTAQRELEALGADAQHWRSLAGRLETELRAAERKREEAERRSSDEINRANNALGQAKDHNMALEDRVACLEAELLATPSTALSSSLGEHELRGRVSDLQRELADAQATVRGQRQQLNDLRGLLAVHMSNSPGVSKGVTAVTSPTTAAGSPRPAFSTSSSARRPNSSSATRNYGVSSPSYSASSATRRY